MVRPAEDLADRPTTPSGRGWLATLGAAAFFVAGTACAAWALRAVVADWGLPSWLAGLAGPSPGFLVILWLLLLLGWSGMAPSWLAARMLRRPLLAMGLPVWAAAGGVVSLFLTRLARQAAGAVGDGPWGILAVGPGFPAELARHSEVFLLLTAGTGAALSAGHLPWPRSAYCAVLMLLLGAPWILMAGAMAEGEPGLTAVLGPFRRNPVAGEIPAAILVVMASALASAMAQVWAAPTAWRVAWGAVATVILSVPGCLLANLVVLPTAASRGAASHLGLWLLVQSFVVVAMSVGAATALSLSPGPVEAPRQESRRSGRALPVLAAACAALIVYGSLVPLDLVRLSFPQAVERFLHTPYLSLGVDRREDLVANLLIFVPLTFLVTGAATHGGRRPGRAAAAGVAVLAACVLAVLIEFVQEFFAPRTVSWNDVLMECVGSILGAGCWLAFGPPVVRWAGALCADRDPLRTAVRVLAAYAVLLFLYEVLPVDFVVSGKELLLKFARRPVTLFPFADAERQRAMIPVKFIAAVPLGFLAGLLARRRPSRAAAGLAAGLLASLVLQVVRLPVYSRTSSLTDVVLWGAGAALGAWLTRRVGPAADRPLAPTAALRGLARIVMGLGAAGLAAAMARRKWQSLDFVLPPGGLLHHAWQSLRVPFYHQYYNSESEAGTQLLAAFGSMAVLGVLLRGFLGGRRLGLWCGAAATCAFSLALEAGRLLLPNRTADATTAVIAMAGGLAGCLAYPRLIQWFVLPPVAPLPEPGPENHASAALSDPPRT